MTGENNPFLGKLRETAGQSVTDADKANIRQVMIDKAVLKFSGALRSDPSASSQATQDKINKGLELQGLNPAEKVAVAQRALEMIEGKNKPTISGGFNASATGGSPNKDHVAALNGLDARLSNTYTNDAERRAEALKSAREFIVGKEGEVRAAIAKQTPEIQAQAQKIMSQIDTMDRNALEGVIHDVASRAKLDISKLTDTDLTTVRTTAKSLVADGLAKATSPAEIQRVLNGINIGDIYTKAADRSLGRLEELFGKIPTARDGLDQAGQGVRDLSQQVQQSYADRDAARAELERLKVTNPDQYKAKCEAMTPEQAPILAGVCVDAFKAPKR